MARSQKRGRIIELAPIGEDGRCTGCGAIPTRETGRCKCYTGPASGLDEFGNPAGYVDPGPERNEPTTPRTAAGPTTRAPQTEAGRLLIEASRGSGWDPSRAILAIEAEARAAALEPVADFLVAWDGLREQAKAVGAWKEHLRLIDESPKMAALRAALRERS